MHIEKLLRHIQAYAGIFSTLCNLPYSQRCNILSLRIFRTESLFKTLWSIDQTYSEPYIEHYSGIFRTLCNTTHIQNPVIFVNIYENLWIIRTLTCLKSYIYSEPSQRFMMDFFAKVIIIKKKLKTITKNYN